MGTFEQHSKVQEIAKSVLAELGPTLNASDCEFSIAERATSLLVSHGVTETWYYDSPAFVLVGSRSCLSISGRHYVPARELVGEFNVVTVDLSPLLDGVWGDCARTFIVENGVYTRSAAIQEFAEGISTQVHLHRALGSFVTLQTTFAELFAFGNSLIRRLGFENLDFHGNLGHSIEAHRDKRIYIEAENHVAVGTVAFFTFEPHIRKLGRNWGFKHEEIYYFNSEHQLSAL